LFQPYFCLFQGPTQIDNGQAARELLSRAAQVAGRALYQSLRALNIRDRTRLEQVCWRDFRPVLAKDRGQTTDGHLGAPHHRGLAHQDNENHHRRVSQLPGESEVSRDHRRVVQVRLFWVTFYKLF
jgi:hypothetical protein